MLRASQLTGFNARSASVPPTITNSGEVGLNSTTTTYALTLPCGVGGKMIIGVVSQGGAGQTLTTWNLAGTDTITSKFSRIDAESACQIGTVDTALTGNQTINMVFDGDRYRVGVFAWTTTGLNITTMSATAGASAISTTLTIPAGGGAVMIGYTGAGATAFSGATGLTTFDGDLSISAHAGGSHDVFATLQTSLAIALTGPGSPSQDICGAVALSSL